MFNDIFLFSILFIYLYIYIFIFITNKFFKFSINLIFLDIYFFLLLSFVIALLFIFEFNNVFYYFFNIYDFVFKFDYYYMYFENSQNSFLISLFVSIFFFFILILTKPVTILKNLVLNLLVIIFLSITFIFSNSLFIIFISFELLLLVSLNLLKLTSKSERIFEAVGEMFLWTLFGSFFLLLAIFIIFNLYNPYLYYFNVNSNLQISNLLSFFFLIGFGVKIPIWPCLSWLLKAHVEASVEFSILLSGFIVKLGILGFIRIMDNFNNSYVLYLLLASALLAIFDSVLRLFSQQDLKRIVALTTIIEMNWIMVCFILGDFQNLFIANYLIVVHTFSTTSEFLLVECISKRFNTRDIWSLGSLWYNSPNLWYISFLVIFITIGFPGTSIFLAKFLFLSSLLNFSLFLFLFFLIIYFFILPVFFLKLWLPLWFGLFFKNNINFYELSRKELFIFFISIIFNIILGIFPKFFIYFFF